MNITRRRSAFVAAAALAAATPIVSAARADPMEQGDRGVAVQDVQRILGVTADGIFGPGTTAALKRFQAKHGLTPDGIVGPATWAAFRKAGLTKGARGSSAHASSSTRSSTTSSGSAVQTLQRKLGISADGVFGPGTEAAVKSFQSRHGLTADGVVGPATWRALGVGGSQPVLKRGGGSSAPAIPAAITRAIAGADRIARTPYVYGGGHGSFTASGYDCSGSVSYVLHAAGLLSVSRDSSGLMSYGSPGPGRYLTVYANAGHAFMVIRGRRYDTSARYETGSRWARELRSTAGYVARHPAGL